MESSSDSDDELQRHLLDVQMAASANAAVGILFLANESSSDDDDSLAAIIDHRTLPRSRRKVYAHAAALHCIRRDYLGGIGEVGPLHGAEFKTMFRVSLSRFERIVRVIIPRNGFYSGNEDATKRAVPSWQARVLLPLKCIAFGAPPHAFIDYFSMSKTQARCCMENFVQTMAECFNEEYLRNPTAADVSAILELHRRKHEGIAGMLGSIDCMHVRWKNCPKAYKGQFKGKSKDATIVLEAACDYNLWFWHASFGHPGTLNNINILNLSPLVDRFLDGQFAIIEQRSGKVPFKVDNQYFDKCFF
jgi:hypothetical protein